MLKNKNDLSAEVAWTLSKNVSNECVLCCVLNMYNVMIIFSSWLKIWCVDEVELKIQSTKLALYCEKCDELHI
jgi:hypothetical protein